MDWALISRTLTHLDTLEPEEVLSELERLQSDQPEMREAIESLRAKGEVARSFMQTHAPGEDHLPASSLQVGDTIGIWQIEGVLGTGGMGEVYRAARADGLFEQRVALKLARNRDTRLAERFEVERQRLAQLEHPNIARIVDGGATESGSPYMTMEFVSGEPIDAYAKAKGLDRKQRLRLIVKLCAALAHAHGRLILHRDVKHANVLINEEGELRLIDFGVAALIDETAPDGRQGPLTLAYAAPEQLLGEPESAATDIFAVGMLAHLLETGALPDRQSDAGVAIDGAALNDLDLAAILSKATAFDPVDRYGSVDAFGDDLEKWIAGHPVAARPISGPARLGKLIARNKLASVMSAAAAIAVIAGLVGVSLFAVRANEAREEAELRVEAAEYYLTESMATFDIAQVASNLAQQYLIEDQGLDEAQFREFLIAKAEEAKLTFASNPEASSALLSFVADHANKRGDYAKSSELAQFILAQDNITEIREIETHILEARNLRELGDSDAAEEESRYVLRWMRAKPFLFETEGYAGLATELALNSLKKEDINEAISATVKHATNLETDEGQRAYHYNNLSVLSSKLGKYEETIEYAIQAVELSKGIEGISPISVNTRSLNLVGYILQHKKDVALAQQYWPAEENVMDPEKGHLRHRSMHRLYEAFALQIEGDHAASHEKAKLAHELAIEGYPPGSPYYLATAGMLIETGALAGETQDLQPLMQSVMMPIESEGGKPSPRGMIARAHLLHAEGKPAEAVQQYKLIDREKVAGSLELTYKLELLEQTLGVS